MLFCKPQLIIGYIQCGHHADENLCTAVYLIMFSMCIWQSGRTALQLAEKGGNQNAIEAFKKFNAGMTCSASCN